MLISELIEQLIKIKTEHTDMPIILEINNEDGIHTNFHFRLIVGNPFSRARYLCIYADDKDDNQ